MADPERPADGTALCVAAFNAFAAVFPEEGSGVGGMETFGWNFAKAIAARTSGPISFLMRHTRRPRKSTVDGVQLLTLLERCRNIRRDVAQKVVVRSGFPWIRIQRWNANLLWQIPVLAVTKCLPTGNFRDQLSNLLDKSRATSILALAVSNETATLLELARDRRQQGILWLQSNADLEQRFFTDDKFIDVHGVTANSGRSALSNASVIVAQTKWQQTRVRELTGHEAVLIRNPIAIERFPPGEDAPDKRDFVLWIGRFDQHHKRPHLAYEIARACPSIRFLMVINRGDPDIEAKLRATQPANVEFVNYVPWSKMPSLFRSARCYLSTGSASYEGFPNVFLEAAASGTPVMSLEDFDDFLECSQSGYCSHGDVFRLATELQKFWNSPDQWREASRSGIEFVRREHSMDRAIEQFLRLMAPEPASRSD